ncbi:MAG: hypothetical protein EB127_14515 [Alphaproteobacteria bacterium]|nr:hypothetical protein [Alphaproteobacteria bacterium]
MSLTPFSRENLRFLKAQKDEEGHQRKLEQITREIYTNAVQLAERKSESVYRYILTDNYNSVYIPSMFHHLQAILFPITKEYIVGNMDEILSRLRTLFPDCSVEYKKVALAMGRDGKEYDILSLDEKLRPFIDISRAQTKEYIVIDWS